MIHLRFKTSKAGVPILKDADIDINVELLLRDYNPELLKTPQPLDVEDFTENYLDYLFSNYKERLSDGSQAVQYCKGCIE